MLLTFLLRDDLGKAQTGGEHVGILVKGAFYTNGHDNSQRASDRRLTRGKPSSERANQALSHFTPAAGGPRAGGVDSCARGRRKGVRSHVAPDYEPARKTHGANLPSEGLRPPAPCQPGLCLVVGARGAVYFLTALTGMPFVVKAKNSRF